MSPTGFITAITTAGILTATKILCFIFEVGTHRDLVPSNASGLLSMVVTIAWGAVFTGTILNRLTDLAARTRGDTVELAARIEARIAAAVEEAGDRRSIQAAVTALSEKRAWEPVGPRQRPTLVEN